MPSLRIVSKVVGKKPKPKTESKPIQSNPTKTGSVETLPHSIKLGNKVKFPFSNKTSTGVVRFIGPTKFSLGLWCGIELSKPEGRNNGTVKGVKYFNCKFNYGIFIQADKVITIDGSLKSDGKQEKTFLKIPSIGKKKSKSLDPICPDLKVKQLDTSIDDDWVVFGEDHEDKKKDAKVCKHKSDDTKIKLSDSVEGLIATDSDNNMKTIITREIDIEHTPLTIKIAESVDSDDNNNMSSEHTKASDHGLMFFITGHQRPGLSPRHKSCPALNLVLDEKTVIDIDEKTQTLSESNSTIGKDDSAEEPKRHSSLKRKLSGIEKRIRSSQLRSPSPGMLRKSFSHGAVFPKENYVAYDDSIERPKFTKPLERCLSDLTLYSRVRSPSGRFPRTPPLLRKPWLRREKTAPELSKDAETRNEHEMILDNEDDVFTSDVVEEDVIVKEEDEEVSSECKELTEPFEFNSTSAGDSKSGSDETEVANINEKEVADKAPVKSLPIFTNVLSSKTPRKYSVPTKIQQKTSVPMNLAPIKHSHSDIDIPKSTNAVTTDAVKSKLQDKVRPPPKLNKRVSDIVATFEKTKSDAGGKKVTKEAQPKVAVRSNIASKVSVKTAAKKQDQAEKDSKKVIPAHEKRKLSQVNKEELAAKEALSQHYVNKETSKKPASPARSSVSGNASTPKTSFTSGAARNSTAGTASRAALRSLTSNGSKDVKNKVVETPRKTSIPVKSTALKVNKPGGSPSHSQSRDEEKKKIRDLKAKCENCENQISFMKEDLRNKNTGIEAFIVVIKQHIEMIEESSKKQRLLRDENNHLHTELGKKENIAESNKQELSETKERQDQSSRDYQKQIENLKKVHNLEKEDDRRLLKEEQSKEIEEVKDKLSKEFGQLRESHEKEIAALVEEHSKLIQTREDEKSKAFKDKDEHYSKAAKDLELRFQTEKEEVCLEYEDRIQDLQCQLESAQEKCYDFEAKNVKLQEELDKDIESQMQSAKAKYKDLPAELESLQCVIELKNDEIRKSRTRNMELQKKVEDLYELEKKFAKIFQEKEALSVALQNKAKCERQLSVERESLAANLEMESRKVKRLSMEKEELMWKFSNSSSLSLSSPSLNIEPPVSPNGFQSTPNTSRSFGRSLKTQSLYLPTLDDEEYTVL